MIFFQHRGKTVSFAKFILHERIAVSVFWNGSSNFIHKSSMYLLCIAKLNNSCPT